MRVQSQCLPMGNYCNKIWHKINKQTETDIQSNSYFQRRIYLIKDGSGN